MSTSQVVRLDAYRSRRSERLHNALALSGWRSSERARTALLAKALEITGADRAVSFWVDEYQGGAVRIDRVVDLASDPPRRTVTPELLERAYDHGFPGLIDSPDAQRAGVLLFPEVPTSSVLLSVGSDGAQSWFVLVDGLTPRSRLDFRQREQLMFLAGELSPLLLQPESFRWRGVAGTFERSREEAFAGWGVLGDLVEGTLDESQRPTVNVRFLTSRLVKTYLDEGLHIERTGMLEQASQIRSDIEDLDDLGDEAALLLRAVDALTADDVVGLTLALKDLAALNEEARRLHAARDFYLTTYEMAVHAADQASAVDAAWGLGRSSRLAADWDGAFRWYQIAADLAREFSDRHSLGRILDGRANAHRDRGALPKARELLAEALSLASADSDAKLRGSVFHTLMTVEKHAGEFGRAIVYGWESVQAQPETERRMWALVDLGAVLMEAGQYDDAEEALHLVLSQEPDLDARVIALSTLSQVASLRGRRTEFTRLCAELEQAEWHRASPIIRGQVIFDRGVSWARLGEPDKARDFLELALAFAEAQKVAQIVLNADAALEELDSGTLVETKGGANTSVQHDHRVIHVRHGLRRYADECTTVCPG